MIDAGTKNILGINIDAVDYEAAVERIVAAAHDRRSYGVTALAVHGVMTGVDSDAHRWRLNHLDLVTPDGQPVRWAMRVLHGVELPDRVYGPKLTLHVCERAAVEGLGVYLFGASEEVVTTLGANLRERFPGLIVSGAEPSKFRALDVDERDALVKRIRDSGAQIVLVGLGCPRQEVFVSEMKDAVGLPMLAVGAAFEYIGGFKSEPPMWIQRNSLQWLHRLVLNPRRLWRRYLILSPRYVLAVFKQKRTTVAPDPVPVRRPGHEHRYG